MRAIGRPALDLHGAFVRRANLDGASLQCANLSGADATNASFRDVDFEGAILKGTVLVGADLSRAQNLTIDQLRDAIIDKSTLLPEYINRNELVM